MPIINAGDRIRFVDPVTVEAFTNQGISPAAARRLIAASSVVVARAYPERPGRYELYDPADRTEWAVAHFDQFIELVERAPAPAATPVEAPVVASPPRRVLSMFSANRPLPVPQAVVAALPPLPEGFGAWHYWGRGSRGARPLRSLMVAMVYNDGGLDGSSPSRGYNGDTPLATYFIAVPSAELVGVAVHAETTFRPGAAHRQSPDPVVTTRPPTGVRRSTFKPLNLP